MKWFFSFSVGDIVVTTGTTELKGTADVVTFLDVEPESYKVAATFFNCCYSISSGVLVTTKGIAALVDGLYVSVGVSALGDGLDVSMGDFVTILFIISGIH